MKKQKDGKKTKRVLHLSESKGFKNVITISSMSVFHLNNAIQKMENSINYDPLELIAMKEELKKRKSKLPKLRLS